MLAESNRFLFGMMFAIWAALLASLSPVFSQVAERDRLGFYSAGDIISLPLDRPIPAARLVIEIDGIATSTPFGVSGTNVSFRIPDDLLGPRHDITLYESINGSRRFIGSWEFELDGASSSYFAAIQAESGIVTDGDQYERYTSFGGRVDFDIDDGRFRGGLSFTRTQDPDPVTGDFLIVDDIYLERRGALFGDDFYTRLGSHYYYAEGNLIDEASRRGLSFRLADPSSKYDVSIFAMQTSGNTEPRNLSGLEDSNDRVVGFVGNALPLPSGEVRFTFAGYEGYAPSLPDGKGGKTRGYGIAMSTPLLQGAAELFVSHDWTSWNDGSGEKSGRATTAELDFQLLPREDDRVLILGLGYSYIDLNYYSALNGDVIPGEEGAVVSLDYANYSWDFAATAAVYETNAGGPSNFPIDRVSRFSLLANYTPQVFTGGFLYGTSFFFGAEVEEQIRQVSPPKSTLPNDQTLSLFSFGMNRFREDHSFALLYIYEELDYHIDAAPKAAFAAGLDEYVHRFEFLLNYSAREYFEATLGASLRNQRSAHAETWEKKISAGFRVGLIPDKLDYIFEGGAIETSTTGLVDFVPNTSNTSGYVRQELEWSFHEDHALVVSAEYMEGDYSERIIPGDGWLFGFALRTDFGRSIYR